MYIYVHEFNDDTVLRRVVNTKCRHANYTRIGVQFCGILFPIVNTMCTTVRTHTHTHSLRVYSNNNNNNNNSRGLHVYMMYKIKGAKSSSGEYFPTLKCICAVRIKSVLRFLKQFLTTIMCVYTYTHFNRI